MTCPSCRSPLPGDTAFCPNCGTRLFLLPADAVASGEPRRDYQTAPTFSGLGTIAPIRDSRSSVLEPGTLFAERYEVVRLLGRGGMGVVYLVKERHTGGEEVLKLIHPDLVQGDEAFKRLIAEGLTARMITHSNIVKVFDVSAWNGLPYFTMEYVPGTTLRSWMMSHTASGRDVPLHVAVSLITSILAGLAEAHRMGVVHRDLKPENVMLDGDPYAEVRPKILDFGIAKALGGLRTSPAAGPMGTHGYMAPEQQTAAEAVGPSADLFSLSVIFYELLMEATPQARWESVSKRSTGGADRHRRSHPEGLVECAAQPPTIGSRVQGRT